MSSQTRRALHGLLIPSMLIVTGLVAEALDAVPSFLPAHVFFDAAVAFAGFYLGWAGAAVSLALICLGVTTATNLGPLGTASVMIEGGIAGLLTLSLRGRVEAMLQSETRFRAVLASMADRISVFDGDGVYIENLPTAHGLPVTPPVAQRIGRPIRDFVPAGLAEVAVAQIRRALQSGSMVNFDFWWEGNGSPMWFNATLTPIAPNRVLWVAHDISDRKETEESVQRANVELEQRVAERTRDLLQMVDSLNCEIARRVSAETAMRESEERLRTIIDQADEFIFCIDRQGVITALNPTMERVLGWSTDAWLGRHFVDLIAPEQRAGILAAFAQGLQSGTIPLTRVALLANDGRRVTVESTLSLHTIEGNRIGFIGVGRDVTAREEAEQELLRKTRHLQEAERTARLGSWEIDCRSGQLWWSDQLYLMHGLQASDEPMTYDRFLALVPEEERAHLDEVNALLFSRGWNEWEQTIHTVGGEKMVHRCAARTIVENGEPVRVIGTVLDITDAKRAEQRLRESEERFHLLARATNDAVCDVDLRTRRAWWNPTFKTLFGHDPEAIADIDAWRACLHPEDVDRVLTIFNEAMEAGQGGFSAEYRFLRADGTYALVLDRVHIVRDEQRQPVRLVGGMTDITERKQLEEQLQQANRLNSLGRIAASIAHEFNNVLMGIQPNVELLKRKAPAELNAVTERIITCVQRGKKITEEILRFTRPTDPALQCVEVASFFTHWVEDARLLLGNGVTIDVDLAVDLHIAADPLQIAQVFTNLALNARDAMPDGGRLTIAAEMANSFAKFHFGVVRTADRFVHITVADEGCGISRERVGHVFEPLFTTKKGGSGLGLAISYQVVTRHGGHIFVESEPGHGTTFHIFLPATSPAIRPAAEEKSLHSGVRRVLLVEDEDAVSSGITMLFEMEGTAVELARSGREALPALERFAPDVVVLDIGLPDMDGIEVFRQIEKRWPHMPVLFSSGHADAAKLESELGRSNVAFLLKPYDFDILRERLWRLVS